MRLDVLTSVYVDVSGSGPDLVLIHGWAMHGGIFASLRAQLETQFRVHCVDLPGHGRSRDMAIDQLQPSRCAAAIAAITPPAIWLGWSLGGLVAMQGAVDQPSHVRGLVGVASSPRFVASADWDAGVAMAVFEQFAQGLALDSAGTVERFLALETMGSPNAKAELRELKQLAFAHGAPTEATLRAGLNVLESTDLRRELASLSQPSLWISGRRDRLIPPAAMQWVAEHAGGDARLLSINAGHAPFLSHPVEVAAEIADFARNIP